MQEYGGVYGFCDFLRKCRADAAELNNACKATDSRIKELTKWRKCIATYNRTKPTYKRYTETNILFRAGFRKKNEPDIKAHEKTKEELKEFPRPLPKVKDLDKELAELNETSLDNNKRFSHIKSELQQFKQIQEYLLKLNVEYQPHNNQLYQSEPQRRAKNNDLSR